ncbi:hypothetical protein ABIB06_001840 [Bradyrhizobium sp. LB8.2]|uniref:hypothetical protein n=1 Tax=unclassified Bradyrhizobium TaxID=2631580 RepID=UPI00339A314A
MESHGGCPDALGLVEHFQDSLNLLQLLPQGFPLSLVAKDAPVKVSTKPLQCLHRGFVG